MKTSIAIAFAVLGLVALLAPIQQHSAEAGPSDLVPHAIKMGKKCSECDFNIKNGLKCTIPAKKTCGTGSLEQGSGFCVAQVTDKAGYCSGRCKSADECKSGYSCKDLKTGAGKVCVK